MAHAAAAVDDARRDEALEDARSLGRHAAEEDAHVAIAVGRHDAGEHLGAAAVDAGHAVHVEDDVLLVRRRQVVAAAAMSRVVAVVVSRAMLLLEPLQPVLEVARVGERQRLGDLDDETALDELDVGRRGGLGVLKVVCARHAAEDLDPRPRAVSDHHHERHADAGGDAQR